MFHPFLPPTPAQAPDAVAVTGLGAITPLGATMSSTWAAVLRGHSGVRRLTHAWASNLPVRIAAEFKRTPAH